MMKVLIQSKVLYIHLLLLLPFVSRAQQYTGAPDSFMLTHPNYGMNRYHEILRYHDPIMYIAYPVIKPVVKRPLALKDGEGKNGYWAEGNFGHRFVIYKGKYYTHPFFQRTRFTFDVSLLTRLTRDNSNPLLPFNGKFGLGLDFLLSGIQQLKKENATLFWTTVQLHHYSNGQADSFFVSESPQRNNYIGGDFSTNYWRVLLNIANQQKNIIAASFGYQRNLDLGGALSASKELENYYGDGRLLLALQWTKKPKLTVSTYRNRATAKTDTVQIEKRRQTAFRTEFEYITGDVSRFTRQNKARIGWHNYLTYMPSVTNEVGIMLHTFIGRDYLNIRFDDIVFIGEVGLYLRFGRN